MDAGTQRRPRDMALLLLAAEGGPPRQRARDQRPDDLGGALRRRVLDQLAALDPEPDELPEALAAIAAGLGEPTGPARGVAALLLEEWNTACASPAYWSWSLREAIEADDRRLDRKRVRPGHAP